MKHRQSNMELLRIVSMFMIVVFHCAYKSGFSFEPGISYNMVVVKTLWMLGELGVNLFMLISGYFMIKGHFRWTKFVLLILEVQFYYWLCVLLACLFGVGSLPSGKDLFLAFFPVAMNRWWFITAYIMIYVLSPYLNILAKEMSLKTYKRFLSVVLVLFCVIPTLFGFMFNTTEFMLYYNRFIWLIVMYFTGAYIARLGHFNPRSATWLTAVSAGVMVLSILTIAQFGEFFAVLGTYEPAYFWPPNTIPMVTLSLGVFGLFCNMHLRENRTINTIASTTLGIYLLSDSHGILIPWLWTDVFRNAEFQGEPYLFLRILGSAAIVCAVCIMIDLLRQQLVKPLAGALDRLQRCCSRTEYKHRS